MTSSEKPIVFFDGVCGLCSGFIDFLFRVDHENVFLVSPLQGETASRLALRSQEREAFNSIALKDEAGIHHGSTAVLRILSRLGGIWRVVGLLVWVPAPMRDAAYYFVARNRYRWFGKKETCRLATPEERDKFLP